MAADHSLEITFPGGVAVAAEVGGHRVLTDQPVQAGGADAAPSPFTLFLVSIGTCAGFYALRFCQQRELSTAGLGLTVRVERGGERGMVTRLVLDLRLPAGFPEKYHEAIVRAVDQCSVKRHLAAPPEIVVALGGGGAAPPVADAG
jgi:ribosomal protein S12 methylthiotransferase accessory factor